MLRKFEIAQQLKQHLSPTFFVKSHIVVQVRFTILQINRFTHLSMLHRRLPVLTEIAPLSFIYVVRRSDVIRIPAISDPEENEYHRCFYRGIRKKKKHLNNNINLFIFLFFFKYIVHFLYHSKLYKLSLLSEGTADMDPFIK